MILKYNSVAKCSEEPDLIFISSYESNTSDQESRNSQFIQTNFTDLDVSVNIESHIDSENINTSKIR
jgi:hypothetical protein